MGCHIPSALDRTCQAADDLLLEDGETDQGRNHSQRGEGQHLCGVNGVFRAEHLYAKWQCVLVGITEHEQRQHVGIPASHEGEDSSGGHARHGQRNDHAPEEAKAGASIEKTGLLKLIRNRL